MTNTENLLQKDVLSSAKEYAVQFLHDMAKGNAQIAAQETGSEEKSLIFPTLEQRLRASLALIRLSSYSFFNKKQNIEESFNECDSENLRQLLVERFVQVLQKEK